MTKLWLCADLHLGSKNVTKFRTDFSSCEEHDSIIYDNLASSVGKRDSLYILGDVVVGERLKSEFWLGEIGKIRCAKKTLVLGNHDTDHKVSIHQLAAVFDDIHSLHARRNVWFSHCPIHPNEMRGKIANIHGHLHANVIDSPRYINVCLEHTGYKPITFGEIQERFLSRIVASG